MIRQILMVCLMLTTFTSSNTFANNTGNAMAPIIQYLLEELKPLRSDTPEQWEEKERRKAELMTQLAELYGDVNGQYQEVLSFLLSNSNFQPNGVNTVLFDPATLNDGQLMAYQESTESFVPVDAPRPEQHGSIRIEALDTDIIYGVVNTAKVDATNVIVESITDPSDLIVIPVIDETTDLRNAATYLETLPGVTPIEIHIYVGLNSDTGVSQLYAVQGRTANPHPTINFASLSNANTHVAYLGSYYPFIGAGVKPSLMVNREFYVYGQPSFQESFSLNGSTQTISENVSFNALLQNDGVVEGTVSFIKTSGGDVAIPQIIGVELNDIPVFGTGSATLRRYKIFEEARVEKYVQVPMNQSLLGGSLSSALGSSGSVTIRFEAQKYIFNSTGLFKRHK